MKTHYIIFLSLFLAALIIRTGYELLKKAGSVDPENKILFTAILLDMITLWVSWFAMCPLDQLPLNLPEFVRSAGLVLFLAGLVLAVGALVQLRGVENIDHLVTGGLFAITRHPMYLGFIFWIVGWSIYHSAAASFLGGCVGIANILFWRHLEEEKLSATFGETYREYRTRTWF